MILMIDHYDSFVHSLARYIRICGYELHTVRYDALSLNEVQALKPSAIILSPGPGHPADTGVSNELVRHSNLPILGVCLGHQIITHSLGGRVDRHPPCHGIASDISHNGDPLFATIPSPFSAARYHALIAEHIPDCLRPIAWGPDNEIMAVKHRSRPIYGVQFHPESVLTLHGQKIISNFLSLTVENQKRVG